MIPNANTDQKSISQEFKDRRKEADERAANRDVYKWSLEITTDIENVIEHNQLVALAVRGYIGREEDLDEPGWAVRNLTSELEKNLKVLRHSSEEVDEISHELAAANEALDAVAKHLNTSRTALIVTAREAKWGAQRKSS